MASKLVWCGRIETLRDIENADHIVLADVVCGAGGRWNGVVKRGQFQVGDLVEVYVQDALLPRESERFAFMEPHGWRIKITRLRGAPSECLIMPWEQGFLPVIGDDITERVGVTKYERGVPWHLAGDMAGPFPSGIPKTDEPNFQAVRELVDDMTGLPCYVSIKYDGSSGTAYWRDGALHVCSRNWELKDKPGNLAWELARKYKLEFLQDYPGVAIQFEMIGPKVQGNPLGLKSPEIRVFNLWDVNRAEYSDMEGLVTFCKKNGLPVVEIVKQWIFSYDDDDDIRDLARQYYQNGRAAEGVVVRAMHQIDYARWPGPRMSFKVINPAYREAE